MTLDSADDRSAAAGEYVLGTLGGDDLRRFEAALAHDSGLRAEVAYWQDRLLQLTHRSAPADHLPQGGWGRLDAALPAAIPPSVAPSVFPSVSAPGPLPWWQRLGARTRTPAGTSPARWQGLSGLAVMACLVLATTLVLREATRPAPEIRYVAVLQDPAGSANGWVVEMTQASDRGGALRLVPLHPSYAVPQGRVLQFWTKAPGAAGPQSLGLVPPGQVTKLPLQQVQDLQADQLFEITLEPPGGSTIGRPTGPILYIGRAVQLGI